MEKMSEDSFAAKIAELETGLLEPIRQERTPGPKHKNLINKATHEQRPCTSHGLRKAKCTARGVILRQRIRLWSRPQSVLDEVQRCSSNPRPRVASLRGLGSRRQLVAEVGQLRLRRLVQHAALDGLQNVALQAQLSDGGHATDLERLSDP